MVGPLFPATPEKSGHRSLESEEHDVEAKATTKRRTVPELYCQHCRLVIAPGAKAIRTARMQLHRDCFAPFHRRKEYGNENTLRVVRQENQGRTKRQAGKSRNL